MTDRRRKRFTPVVILGICLLVFSGCPSSSPGEGELVCEPGALSCEGNEVVRCNNEGTGLLFHHECARGEICSSGVCDFPGEHEDTESDTDGLESTDELEEEDNLEMWEAEVETAIGEDEAEDANDRDSTEETSFDPDPIEQEEILEPEPEPFTCAPDEFEPNPDETQAALLSPPVSDRDLTLCDGEDDWYRFPMNQGDSVHAVLRFSHERSDIDMHLYRMDDYGQLLRLEGAGSIDDDEELVFNEVGVAGDYFLKVYSIDGRNTRWS